MGLDTTHNAWHGGYGRFNAWRINLASKIGITLQEMEGFGGDGKWDETIDLYPLLYHSDCDGELTPDECKKTIKGLTDILSLLDGEGKERAIQFITGCADAVSKNENILFQ
jgi:hypothetical protein